MRRTTFVAALLAGFLTCPLAGSRGLCMGPQAPAGARAAGAAVVHVKNLTAGAPNLKIALGASGRQVALTPDLPENSPYRFRPPVVAEDGSATTILIYVSGQDIPEATYRITITGEVPPPPDPQPPVPPPIPPTPPVPPTPLTWTWAVVVAESADLTPIHAAVLDSQKVLAEVRRHGHSLQRVDPTSPGTFASYADRAAGKPQPYLLLVAEDGTIRWEGKLPTNEIATMELLTGTKAGAKQ